MYAVHNRERITLQLIGNPPILGIRPRLVPQLSIYAWAAQAHYENSGPRQQTERIAIERCIAPQQQCTLERAEVRRLGAVALKQSDDWSLNSQ